MSDSEQEFEFGDEVPKPTKQETEQLVSLADKIPIRKIPKKRALPPTAPQAQDDDLSEGEIESKSDNDSEFEDYGDDSSKKDHTLRKMDKLDNDDFEVTLSSLKKKSSSGSATKKKKSSKTEEKTPKKKSTKTKSALKTPTKKTKSSSSKSSSSTKKSSSAKKKTPSKTASTAKSSSSTLITESSELYGKCDKGRVIKQLLCRWWYAIQWPNPSSLPDKPPANYDSLDGFPGVFICTSGDEVGHIMDVRGKDTCPNFVNFSKKDAKELIDLLLEAIAKQKEVLIENEGSGTSTEKELADLNKWALKLNPEKVDKDALKIVKAYQLTKH